MSDLNKPPPCFGCTDDRNATCHSTCKKYLDWSSERRKKLDEVNKIKAAEQSMTAYILKQSRRLRRIKNERRRKER